MPLEQPLSLIFPTPLSLQRGGKIRQLKEKMFLIFVLQILIRGFSRLNLRVITKTIS